MQEFLLVECRLRYLGDDTGISQPTVDRRPQQGIYSPTGAHRDGLQPGINIIVDADGNTRKVLVR